MNKAEEQLMFQWGQIAAKEMVICWGIGHKTQDYFLKGLKEICNIWQKKDSEELYQKGKSDYFNSILRLIENNVITDWPSFVTHMTGETYE